MMVIGSPQFSDHDVNTFFFLKPVSLLLSQNKYGTQRGNNYEPKRLDYGQSLYAYQRPTRYYHVKKKKKKKKKKTFNTGDFCMLTHII
jgi:hypothetical protein